jgi:hypothetical protein
MDNKKLNTYKRIGTGWAIIIFPIMLLLGFVTHPNLFSFEMITNATDWANEWYGNFMFHFGHLLVLFAVPLIIAAAVYFMSILTKNGSWYGFIGGILSVFGAFMLAVDKGSLCLVLTGLQTVPQDQFAQIMPAVESIFNKAGWLWINWLFLFLQVGFIILAVDLIKEKFIPKWQGWSIIIGLLLLINPDIEIISSTGAILMCIGFIPIGVGVIKGSFGNI